MKYPHQTNILVDCKQLLETLWKAEQTRDLNTAIFALQEIWDDFDVEPNFSAFSVTEQAELFRLSGHFLGNYGKDKNQTNYQERAKNLLTKAIEIYTNFKDFNKVADAQNALAMCYLREGAILESEAILEQTVVDYLSDKLDLVYLQNRGNLLIAKLVQKKYEEAVEIIEEIIVPMEFCKDKKACFVFHEKAGNVFNRIKLFNKAVFHYQKAVYYAEELNNLPFLTSCKNNLANLFRKTGSFDSAHFYEDEAISIAKADNQTGWLPIYLDTKALIYFDEGNFKSALETIDEAISIFKKGEDAGGLTEALWNKCKFLLHLNRKKEAIKLFAELAPIASERMGDFALDNFADEFAELIHVKKGGSFEEETRRFRRVEIITAIRKAKYEMKTAAELLKISQADLTRIIDQEFPELFEEINIERFTALENEPKEIVENIQRDISQLFLPVTTTNLTDGVSTFYIASEIAEKVFDVSQDIVLSIEPVQKIVTDEYILVQNKLNGSYSFGKALYDEFFDLYYIVEKDEPMPISLDEVKLTGKATAFIPFSEIDNERLEFKPLSF